MPQPPIFAPTVLSPRAGPSSTELVTLPPVTVAGVDVKWTPEHRGRFFDPAAGVWRGDRRYRAQFTLPFPPLTEAQGLVLASALWSGEAWLEPFPLGPGVSPAQFVPFVCQVGLDAWAETRDRILRRRPVTIVATSRELFSRPWGRVVTAPDLPRPLDPLAGASVALALQRQFTSYTGPLVRVRRSDGAELDLLASDGLLNVAALLTFAGSGDATVRTWYDQAPAGAHAQQPDPARQPWLVQGGVLVEADGAPAVRFNGTSHWLAAPSVTVQTWRARVTPASAAPGLAGLLSNGQDGLNIRRDSATTYRGQGNTDGGDFTNAGGQLTVDGVTTNSFLQDQQHLLVAVAVSPRAYVPGLRLGVAGDSAPLDTRLWKGTVSELTGWPGLVDLAELDAPAPVLSGKTGDVVVDGGGGFELGDGGALVTAL